MWKMVCGLVVIALLAGCQRPDAGAQPSSDTGTTAAVAPGADSTAARRLFFSGYEWIVKAAGDGPVGPGLNYFADGPDAVWVDAGGRLHLRLQFKYERWWAAEVISARSFGFGTYRFHLDTNVDDLDPNVILGLFTWSDDQAFAHRELDIEMGRWGQDTNDLGQCVVQPYERPENLVRFALPQGLRASLHSFTWRPDRVACQILAGPDARPDQSGVVLYEHTFTAGIPAPGGENARINLWLLGGQGPRHGQDIEVVIGRFEFLPL